MTRLRLLGPLLLSILLISLTGALAVGLTTQATDKAEAIHLQDRQQLEATLGGLGKQYLLFSMKEGLDYARTGTWNLRPGDPADAARLQSFVTHAVLLNYGVALVDLGAHPLSVFAEGPGLPPPSDPGYRPMVSALLKGQPDVSSVMTVDGIHVVAMGVPVTVGGAVKAVFVGYVRLDTSALETYVRKLHFGTSGRAYVVDSTGTVVAATDPAQIGRHVSYAPTVDADVVRGQVTSFLDGHSNTVVSVGPFGLGGWGGVATESASEFYGPIRSGNVRVELAIVALLVVAALIVVVLNHRRETARRRYQAQLAYQAAHDGLTGLFNRSVFHERLAQALARARRQFSDIAVLYLDLDVFKPVNDHKGHGAGDTVLATVADRLKSVVRTADTVARMGGDEFVVLLEDVTGPSSVERVAERIVADLGTPVDLHNGSTTVGVSVGIAYSHGGLSDAEAMIRDADLAMYQAKDAGGSRFAWAVASQPVA